MTSSATPKVILLAGSPMAYEAPAAAAITPGKMVNVTSAGVGLAAAASPTRMIAKESVISGIAEDYATGENVHYYSCRPGDRVYAWLATSQVIALGARLSSVADGNLAAATVGSQAADSPFAVVFPTPVIARALEAVTTTGAVARIKVEIV